MARVLSFLKRYFSNYYTLHRSNLAAGTGSSRSALVFHHLVQVSWVVNIKNLKISFLDVFCWHCYIFVIQKLLISSVFQVFWYFYVSHLHDICLAYIYSKLWFIKNRLCMIQKYLIKRIVLKRKYKNIFSNLYDMAGKRIK